MRKISYVFEQKSLNAFSYYGKGLIIFGYIWLIINLRKRKNQKNRILTGHSRTLNYIWDR